VAIDGQNSIDENATSCLRPFVTSNEAGGMKTLHIILFVLLAICTQSLAQNQEQEEFYRLYPDLRAHKEIVQTAYEQLKQSGFQAKTLADANRSVAIRAYLLLNKSSGAKIPYWQVLEEYNRARSELPEIKDMSLPEFARQMNEITGSSAYDEGLNGSWLRRAGTFLNRWGILMLLAALGLIFLVIIWGRQGEPAVRGESVWQRAMRPAGAAATWGSICGALSMSKVPHQNLSLGQWIGLFLGFSVTLAIVFAVPVYLIAALSYAIRASRRLQSSTQPGLDLPSKLIPPQEIVGPANSMKSVGRAPNEKYALQRQQDVEKPPAEGPRGIGGWLVFFCISLTILRPLWWIVEINYAWTKAQPALDRFPALKTAVFFETAGSAAIVLYSFIIGCLIWNGVPYGKRIAKQYLLIQLVAVVVVEVVAVGLMPPDTVNAVIAAMIPNLLGAAIYTLIWYLYFKRSVRVRNTYG
jgi:hypothetical protein